MVAPFRKEEKHFRFPFFTNVLHNTHFRFQLFAIGVNCCIPHSQIGRALQNLDGIYDSCQPGTDDGFHPPPCHLRTGHHDHVGGSSSASTTPPLSKLLILYPNSGEVWVGTRRRGRYLWPPNMCPNKWTAQVSQWIRRQIPPPESPASIKLPLAQWVGGCCRVGPDQIRSLAEWMKPGEFGHCTTRPPDKTSTSQQSLTMDVNDDDDVRTSTRTYTGKSGSGGDRKVKRRRRM